MPRLCFSAPKLTMTQVFLQHPDRFMVGTDTWVTSR
jgi:hypothetical protein